MTTQLATDIVDVLPKLEGWCTPEKALAEASLIIEHDLKIAVEIGVFGGSSLVPKAMAMRATGGKVYGIDPWHKLPCIEGKNDKANDEWWSSIDIDAIHKGCVHKLWELGLNEQVVLLRAKSEQCADLFSAIDLLEIDGNHSELASCRDVKLYLPKVKRGGFIVFDDYDWQTTQAAAALLEKQCDKLLPAGGKFMIYRKR